MKPTVKAKQPILTKILLTKQRLINFTPPELLFANLKHLHLFLFGFVLFIISCSGKDDSKEFELYFCDAENLVIDGDDRYFLNNGDTLRGGWGQTDEEAFEGNYSIKLDSTVHYGFTIKFDDVEPGEYFEISVMEKSESPAVALVATVSWKAHYSLIERASEQRIHPGEWNKISMSFSVETDAKQLTIFAFSNNDVAYFDNFEVKRYKKRPELKFEARNELKLNIDDSAMVSLNSFYDSVIVSGIIDDEFKDYVEALISDNGHYYPVEMRLKGDWADHVNTGKTSYRIKTSSTYAYQDLRSFSIQHPGTRNYMHEWFAHQLLEGEGLLSTRYDFVPVYINDHPKGVYALEEHFDKQLLESRNRREGPILKMDEAGFWQRAVIEHEKDSSFQYPFYQSSYVSCFKINRTMKSDVLSAQFVNGSQLLNLFSTYYKHPEDIFDLDRTAKFYALMDLANVSHALAWHNRRYYYNPVTAELEHIAFDLQPGILPMNDLLVYRDFKDGDLPFQPEMAINRQIFLSEEFRSAYTTALERFSSEAFLDSCFNSLTVDIEYYNGLIGEEYPGHLFRSDFYYKKAELIRAQLDTLDQFWDRMMQHYKGKPVNVAHINYPELDRPFYIEDISVNLYLTKIDSMNYFLEAENFHPNELEIIGYSVKYAKDVMIPLDTSLTLKRFDGAGQADYGTLHFISKPSRIFFRIGNDSANIYKKKPLKWAKPKGDHPRIELKNGFRQNHSAYRIEGQKVIFKSGIVNELLYIPKEYKVEFPAGTNIDFVNGGGVITNNQTSIKGTSDNKVIFTSSDSSARGITILKGKNVSIEHLEMSGFKMLDYKGWILTGALTVYEANVTISNTYIHHNHCEDALNLIRCNFDVSNIRIEYTKSDAFDADFCTGVFIRSSFANTGNDCIDFSGSVIDISDIDIVNSGDKGVSAGERSTLTLKNISVNGALTGVASKDDSMVFGSEINIANANVGVAAFQKKPEYAGGTMELTNVSYENLHWPAWIEQGSVVHINGKKYWGIVKFDIDAMYARFEK